MKNIWIINKGKIKKTASQMSHPATHQQTFLFSAFCILLFLTGCGNKFFDPAQIGRFRPVPAVNVILDSLGVAEETPSVWAGTEEPRPIDVIAFETDYVFNPGDIARISIFELQLEGVLFERDYVITETGKVSIPDVGVVEAAGLTESQLEEEIKQILAPGILREPSITVTLMDSQQRTFSISGNGVPAPGRYNIPRYDFRLLDALAVAKVATQFNVSNIYVSRFVTGGEAMAEPIEPEVAEPEELEELEKMLDLEREMLEIISPQAGRQQPGTNRAGAGLVIVSAEMATDKELAEPTTPETIDKPINEQEKSRIEWLFQDGRWVPVQIGRPEPAEPMIRVKPQLEEKMPVAFDWDQIGTGGTEARVIKIPTDKLAGGDPRYNVVIKPGDNIQVPVDLIGDFYIMGNTNYQGYIDLTGRPMTLKMAVAAAGGLGPLAWPKRCEVVRRIGKNKEETVMVDLDKIARGEQPDFFIKPNDWINVGTHPTSRWRAVLRNAFRATYGFGFIYDRNFADRDFGTHRPIPDWF